MQIPTDAILLRIFLGESDRWEHKPLYEAIVMAARAAHLAGATVLRGPMGFGKSSRLHTAKILRLSMDLPLVIEIVDSEEKIISFLPTLDKMIGGGLVTLEKVKVLHYRSGQNEQQSNQGTKCQAGFVTSLLTYCRLSAGRDAPDCYRDRRDACRHGAFA